MPRPKTLDLDKLDGRTLFDFLLRRPGECNRAIEIGKTLGNPRFIGDWDREQCLAVVERMGKIRAGVN